MSGMHKFCPECGKQLPGEAKFCDGCGTNVGELAPMATEDAPPVQPMQSVPLQTEQSAAAHGGGNERPFQTAQPFNAGAVRTSDGAGIHGFTKPLAAILAVLLVLTVLVNVARGTIYRAFVRLNVEKLYDEVYDEYGKYNTMVDMLDDIVYYSANVRIDDAVEFLNSRKVKRSVQKAANSVFDMILTGNPKKLISEDEVEKIVKSLTSEINSKLGERLSSSDVGYVTRYIMNNYVYELFGDSDRYIRAGIEDFWEYEAPEGMKVLRPLLHPTTRTILTILDILAIVGLVVLNLRKLGAVPRFVGIPLVISGGISAILVLLTGVWASLIAEEFYTTSRIARYLLSGYSGTAVRYAFMYILFGVMLLVIDRLMSKEKAYVQSA